MIEVEVGAIKYVPIEAINWSKKSQWKTVRGGLLTKYSEVYYHKSRVFYHFYKYCYLTLGTKFNSFHF